MKKLSSCAIALIAVLTMSLGIAGCGNGGGGAADGGDASEVFNLMWAHPFPAMHHVNRLQIEPLVERLYERSGGRLNITVEPGGTLTTTTTAIDDVSAGTIDITWVVVGNTPGRFPLLDALELPGLFDTSVEATRTLWGMHDEDERFRNEFGDYIMIAMYTADIGEVWTTSPVRSPSDMQGMNLRSPSPMAELALRQFGSGVVGMGMPDVYDSIERGVIDGLATAPSAINTYSLYEVVNYGTIGMNLYAGAQLMAISQRAWNLLPADLQQIIREETGYNFSVGVAAQYDRLGSEARDGIVGIEFQVLTPAEQAVFVEMAYPLIEQYLNELDGLGYDGQAFFDMMMRHRDAIR